MAVGLFVNQFPIAYHREAVLETSAPTRALQAPPLPVCILSHRWDMHDNPVIVTAEVPVGPLFGAVIAAKF